MTVKVAMGANQIAADPCRGTMPGFPTASIVPYHADGELWGFPTNLQ